MRTPSYDGISGLVCPPLPVGATDCHCHVFDPVQFPYAAERSYTPGPATVDDQRAFHAHLGTSRVVLVQPSVYGTDNRCLVEALARLGPQVARGIAVINPDAVADDELAALRSGGVVGVRVNLAVKGERREGVSIAALSKTLSQVAPLGFAVQVYADLPLVAALAGTIAASPVPVILDHFGGAQAHLGLGQPGFDAILRLLGSGKAYVKLSATYRASHDAPGYTDLIPVAQALIHANPDRILWGSDWPHTGGSDRAARKPGDVEPFRTVDDARMLALLCAWAGGADVARKVLVGNPARLFGF